MSAPDPGFEQLLEFVRDERGFDYTGYRRPTLMRRFQKRMQDVGADDWEAYRAYLGEHSEEFVELFNTILINVTGFFRDRETWDLVASEVVPRLLEERGDAPIRVWSAGCASGEEPYTVAMLLAEALGEEGFRRQVKIYATDIDDDALTEARDASYSAKQLEKVPPELRKRYFEQQNHGFAFRNDLRRAVIFGRNDLHRDPPISRVDLLVSRNTLMYFGSELQQRILANFYFALNRGGFLVVGKAEALQSGRNFFVPYNLKRRIFMKDGSIDPAFRVPRLPPPSADHEQPRDLGEAAFEHAPVAQVVVDDQSRVAGINQAARTMFTLRHRTSAATCRTSRSRTGRSSCARSSTTYATSGTRSRSGTSAGRREKRSHGPSTSRCPRWQFPASSSQASSSPSSTRPSTGRSKRISNGPGASSRPPTRSCSRRSRSSRRRTKSSSRRTRSSRPRTRSSSRRTRSSRR